MSGKSADKFNSWRDKLLKVLSYVEAKIDFPDEDLPKNIIKKIKKESNGILSEIKKSLKDDKVGERIREGFKIAIIGPPNSGKSSLLNYLSKRDVAIVSETAGTTRDVIETHLNLDGYPVIVSDTAGIRSSKNEIEQKGIKIALNRAEDADLKLVIVPPKNVDFTSLLKKLLTNNILILEIDSKGVLVSKKFYDKKSMQKVKFEENITNTDYSKRSFVFNFLSSLRQKIDDPLGKKRAKVNQQ